MNINPLINPLRDEVVDMLDDPNVHPITALTDILVLLGSHTSWTIAVFEQVTERLEQLIGESVDLPSLRETKYWQAVAEGDRLVKENNDVLDNVIKEHGLAAQILAHLEAEHTHRPEDYDLV